MTERSSIIADLISHYLSDTLSSTEQIKLDQWIREKTENRDFFEKITGTEHLIAALQKFHNYDLKPIENALSRHYPLSYVTTVDINQHEQDTIKATAIFSPVHRMRPILKWGWAAAIIFAIGSIFYLMLARSGDQLSPVAIKEIPPVPSILPGGQKATLTLADGSTILLDSAGIGVLALQGQSRIEKTASGQIRYTTDGEVPLRVEYNTMSTPRGGQYALRLPDGSTVWLNAASSITYPTSFAGQDRKVTLSGEAYFEVVKNTKQPFMVVSGDMEVRVLGTHFNINAYQDEISKNTTLLEGKVLIRKGTEQQLLSPGQQARVGSDIILTDDIDLDEVIAWKRGYFNFNSSSIQELMREVSRWYNVEVVYEGQISRKRFSGIVSRASHVKEVLAIMEKAGIKFRIEGKRVTVVQ